MNMKEWQCGVFQICDGRGDPMIDPIAYALFFNHLVGINGWCFTGEYNKDGIFHVHALLKTPMRSDSLRRSMGTAFNNLMCSTYFRNTIGTQQGTMDVLKLQKCHKPTSLIAYMMKKPLWIVANDTRYVQYTYDLVLFGMHLRFQEKDKTSNEPETSTDMHTMTKEMVDLIITNGCKTFEDCLRHGPEVMSKYLHRAGLKQIVENCLQFVKSTGGGWSLALYEVYDPDPSAIHKVLLHQGIIPGDFDIAFHAWITKSDSKRNCICIQGPSNSGKSAFISGLKQCVAWGEVTNGSSGFNFEGLIDACIGVWEEPLINTELAEKWKQVMEGMITSIPVKYKKPYMLPRTPMIVTTNHDLWRFCNAEETMFRNRMWHFTFQHNCKDAFYTPRATEYSCECPYCRASSGRALAARLASLGGLQGEEQPVPSRELSSGSPEERDVRARPMSGGTRGTKRSHSGTPSSPDGSSGVGSTRPSSGHSRSSSPNVGHVGSFRILRPSDNERRRSELNKHVESNVPRGRHGESSGSNGSRQTGGGSSRGNGSSEEKYGSPRNVSTKSSDQTPNKEIPANPKKQRVGRVLGSKVGQIKFPMVVPLKSDWQEYLSYLYHWYG